MDADPKGVLLRKVEVHIAAERYAIAARIILDHAANVRQHDATPAERQPVQMLDVGPEVAGLLERHGMATIGAVAARSPAELRELHGVGPGRVRAIRRALKGVLNGAAGSR